MNFWDERYGEPGYAYGEEPNDFLREVAPSLAPGRVLCLGEGEGRNGVFLAGLGHSVTAADASAVGLEKALALAARRGVRLSTVHADLTLHELGEGCWDAVVSIWFHLASHARRAVHGRVRQALAPGGLFIVEAYAPAQLALGTGGPRDADLLVSAASLDEDFAGFERVRAAETERWVDEGRYHQGRSAVTQAVFRRPR